MEKNNIINLLKLFDVKSNNKYVINPADSLIQKIDETKKKYSDIRLEIKNIENKINNLKN